MRRAGVVLLLGASSLAWSTDAEALRCGSRLVDRGASEAQVLARCGEPFWRTSRVDLRVDGVGAPLQRRVEQRVEHWYFNFGPSRLMTRLRFLDGRVDAEDTLGYGAVRVGGRCTAPALRPGASEGELVLRCGAPLRRRTTYADQVLYDGGGRLLVQPRPREEWLLRRDDSRLLARVVLEDGRIRSVEAVRP